MACCGLTPYNNYTQLCCNGVVREKNRGGRYADSCCGTEALRPDQTCCSGTVHNVVDGDCCGSAVYFKGEGTFLCCNDNLARKVAPTDMCCGSTVYDGGRQQICCGDRVSDMSQADACCTRNNGSEVEFHSSNEFCCNGAVRKGMDLFCCYLRINGELVAESYNNNTHCCRYPFDIIYPKLGGDCLSHLRPSLPTV
ncbi:hypothetical protein Y032_0205g1948 [Ancylostoma ceylanicum]|nr:hypothetical protein Y032_0205g1948 [Ancylostoma ceylanicum]